MPQSILRLIPLALLAIVLFTDVRPAEAQVTLPPVIVRPSTSSGPGFLLHEFFGNIPSLYPAHQQSNPAACAQAKATFAADGCQVPNTTFDFDRYLREQVFAGLLVGTVGYAFQSLVSGAAVAMNGLGPSQGTAFLASEATRLCTTYFVGSAAAHCSSQVAASLARPFRAGGLTGITQPDITQAVRGDICELESADIKEFCGKAGAL